MTEIDIRLNIEFRYDLQVTEFKIQSKFPEITVTEL